MSPGIVAPTEAVKLLGAVWLVACLLRSLHAVRSCERVNERLSFAIEGLFFVIDCIAGDAEVFDIACGLAADATPIPDASETVAAIAMR
jgi:hypothetical protein